MSSTQLRYYRKKNAPPPIILLRGSVIRINVGESPYKKTYFVHKSLLCHYSTYFEAMLTNPLFAEGRDTKGYQTVNLEEESTPCFERMYHWLYNGSVSTTAEHQDYNTQNSLVSLWLFADRRGIPALQNDALDAINKNSNVTGKLCELSIIQFLWNDSPRSSAVRKWIVEHFVGVKNIETLFNRDVPAHWKFPPQDFVQALSVRQSELVRRGRGLHAKNSQDLGMCPFHEHRDGKDCSALKQGDKALRDQHGMSELYR